MTDHLLNDRKVGLPIKRSFSGQQLVEHDASREQVSPRIHRPALHLLW